MSAIQAREATPRFEWTDERKAQLRACYGLGQVGAAAARVIGCTAQAAIKKASRLGLDGGEATLEARRQGGQRGSMLAAATGANRGPWAGAGPRVPDDELIAAAIAEGRVTICPPGRAGGTSPLELHLGFAPGAKGLFKFNGWRDDRPGQAA